MRALVQRVSRARVAIDGEVAGAIGAGYCVFLGVGQGDTRAEADRLLAKILKLRICADANGKTNLSLNDVGGSMLAVSQFTLYADCRKGNRPSFTDAGAPDAANDLYGYFASQARAALGEERVATGVFAADMQVELTNDGPFTIWLDTADL